MTSGPLQSRIHNGVVVQAGKLLKVVKVRVPKQTWNKRIQKYFSTPIDHLVSDPTSSAREGDIVQIASGWRVTKNIRHCLHSIITPFGTPLTARPAVPTVAEREATKAKARLVKDIKQAARGRLPSQQRVNIARKQEKFEEFGIEDPNPRQARQVQILKAQLGPDWAEKKARMDEQKKLELAAAKRDMEVHLKELLGRQWGTRAPILEKKYGDGWLAKAKQTKEAWDEKRRLKKEVAAKLAAEA